MHREGVLCSLLIVKLAPQADTGSNRMRVKIHGHTQKYEDFETIQEKLTTVVRQNASRQWLSACGLCELFPNVCISLGIFLTIPATVESAERSFSKLKLVKNYLRSTMSQTLLVDISRLSIEPNIARQGDFDSVIINFARRKVEKRLYYS